MHGMVWIDGSFKDYEAASVPILTHSISYATSVYEGIRAYGGKVFKLKEHLNRLRYSASVFHHNISFDDEILINAILHLIETNSQPEGYIKIQVIFDDSDFGYAGLGCKSRIMISIMPKPRFPHDGPFSLSVSKWRRPAATCHPYAAKTSSTYALSFLGFRARNPGFDDVLFVSEDDRVCEASGANIFFVKGDDLVTPKTDMCLDGITRRAVLETIAPSLGLKPIVSDVYMSQLGSFDTCFMCGTAVEIRGISHIDTHRFPSSNAVRKVSSAYEKLVHTESPPCH